MLSYYLKEKYNIQTATILETIEINKDEELYNQIHKKRVDSAQFREDSTSYSQLDVNPLYTDHAYRVVKYFVKKNYSGEGKDLEKMDCIYLTYSKTTGQAYSEKIKYKHTWQHVMGVNNFSIKLLFHQCLNNSNFLSVNLTEAIIIDAYAKNALTSTAKKNLQEVIKNPEFSDYQRNLIIEKSNTDFGKAYLNTSPTLIPENLESSLTKADKDYEKRLSEVCLEMDAVQSTVKDLKVKVQSQEDENAALLSKIQQRDSAFERVSNSLEEFRKIDRITKDIISIKKDIQKNYINILLKCFIIIIPIVIFFLTPLHDLLIMKYPTKESIITDIISGSYLLLLGFLANNIRNKYKFIKNKKNDLLKLQKEYNTLSERIYEETDKLDDKK